MNTWIATCTLAISIALTGLIVEWLARHAHPRRLLYVNLGRPRTSTDDRRALRLRVANAAITTLGVVLALSAAPDWARVSAGVLAPSPR